MTRKLTIILLACVALSATASLHAQVTLNDFSSFESAHTLFFGDWSLSGDPFAGSISPVASFSQGSGFYNLASVTNVDSAFVDYTFGSPLNLGASDSIALSLKLLADNTADQFSVILFNDSGENATATFLLNAFNGGSFTTVTSGLSVSGSFDPGAVSYFRLTGNDPFAAGTLSVALNQLSATSAIPEPGTYAAIFGAVALGGVMLRRRFQPAAAA